MVLFVVILGVVGWFCFFVVISSDFLGLEVLVRKGGIFFLGK